MVLWDRQRRRTVRATVQWFSQPLVCVLQGPSHTWPTATEPPLAGLLSHWLVRQRAPPPRKPLSVSNRLRAHSGFPGGAAVKKEHTCQCRRGKRRGFDPWISKSLWRREWQPTPVFLPEKCHRQRSLVGYSQGGNDWLTKQAQWAHSANRWWSGGLQVESEPRHRFWPFSWGPPIHLASGWCVS